MAKRAEGKGIKSKNLDYWPIFPFRCFRSYTKYLLVQNSTKIHYLISADLSLARFRRNLNDDF